MTAATGRRTFANMTGVRRGLASLATAMMVLSMTNVVVTIAPIAATAEAATCPGVGDPRYDELRELLPQMVSSGVLSQARADQIACDPAAEVARISRLQPKSVRQVAVGTESAAEVSPMAAVACSSSGYVFKQAGTMETRLGSPFVGWMKMSLGWCYNKKYVKDWTGFCNGGTTAYGKAIGYAWEGCVNDDYIAYTLGGRYPGGIHHQSQGKFGMNFVGFPDVTTPTVHVWGHYDGTCDVQFGSGTVYHSCSANYIQG